MKQGWRGLLELVSPAIIAIGLAVGLVWATVKFLDFLK
jgi:hypothetical protein